MTEKILLAALLLLSLALLVRVLREKRYAYGWTARFIASPQFLQTPEWRRVRYDVLRANDGRCELCGRHGTRLFYELLSCGEPFRRMGRGGWPVMRSLQQWMASLWAARRIFLSRSKPTRKID